MAVEAGGRPNPKDVPPSTSVGSTGIPRPGGGSLDTEKPVLPRGGYGEVMKRVYIGPPGNAPEKVIVAIMDSPTPPLIDPKIPYLRQSILQPDSVEAMPKGENAKPPDVKVPPEMPPPADPGQVLWEQYADNKTGIATLLGKRSARTAFNANKDLLESWANGSVPMPTDAALAKIVETYSESKRAGRKAFEEYYTKIAS
ncbi:MAG: hypothetical protein H0W89_05145 [Candidatus Levybacteria bacterium]|nr:hypothetical protein [Candidatus Levybacteria bacterium]